jgi:hypothetical protein
VVSDDSLSCVDDDVGAGNNQSSLASANQAGAAFLAGGGFGPAAAGGDLYRGARVVEDAGGIYWLEMTTNRLEGTTGQLARQYYRLGTRAEVFNAAGKLRGTVARQIIRVLENPRNYRFLGRIILRGLCAGGVLLLFEGAAVAGEVLPRLVLSEFISPFDAPCTPGAPRTALGASVFGLRSALRERYQSSPGLMRFRLPPRRRFVARDALEPSAFRFSRISERVDVFLVGFNNWVQRVTAAE